MKEPALPISADDKKEWAEVKEKIERPSVRAKLKQFQKEIDDEEKAKEKQMADIAAMAQALKNQRQ